MKCVKRIVRAVLAMSFVASAAACTKTQAKTPDQVVVLNTPAPPARVTIPVEIHQPEPEPAPAPPTAASVPPPAKPRTEPAARPTTPAAVLPATEMPSAPVLQTTVDVGALEQRTQGLLKEAQGNLDRTRYSDISLQARAQYDLAKSFIRTAFRALRDKNYTYAEYLAAKAAAIAKELAKG